MLKFARILIAVLIIVLYPQFVFAAGLEGEFNHDGVIGIDDFRTMDNMSAFAKSVNFVIGEKDLPKIKAIVKQAVADNEQFYHVFREALRDVGKT